MFVVDVVVWVELFHVYHEGEAILVVDDGDDEECDAVFSHRREKCQVVLFAKCKVAFLFKMVTFITTLSICLGREADSQWDIVKLTPQSMVVLLICLGNALRNLLRESDIGHRSSLILQGFWASPLTKRV